MKIYKHPVRQEFELEKPKPKIEFRYVVEFEASEPEPECYDVDRPLSELSHDELEAMAKIDLEYVDLPYMIGEKEYTVYVEIIIDGTVFRRVKA